MSDLDFDLNAPAAPSLTLDAAPAAPTLTLDPEADAKVVEEAKKATPVTVEDTPLSPEEQKMVQDFAEKIDLTNSQMILQYGAASQKKLSDFSDSALSRVRTKDMGETGELITKERLEIKGLGKAKYILKPGGTLGDLYTNSDLVYNDDGYIEVDKNGLVTITKACAVAGLGGKVYRSGDYDYYINETIRNNDPKAVGPFIMASLEYERLQK